MKIVFLIALLQLIVGNANAQSVPHNDFRLKVSQESLTIKKGETDSVRVSVVRSKLYRRGKAVFGISSREKKGLSAEIHMISQVSDTCILKISTDALAEPGEYFVLPNCTIQGKTIGRGFKIRIN